MRSAWRPSTGDDDALERAALLSASFHRCFGARYGREQMPNELRPLSCGETSRALEKIVQQRQYRRYTVRGCLARMLASGYIPDPHNAEQFEKLARRVDPKREDAIAALREMGKKEADAPDEEVRVEPGAPRVPIAGPTVISFRENVFTVRKQVALPHRYDDVKPLVQPRNWKKLGPFWKVIKEQWDDEEIASREGMIYEHFVLDWNTIAMQEYKVLLKGTQRSRRGFIRTDYSLVYEEEGRLLVDEGYGQAEAIPDRPGWTRYTGVKTLKFASSFLNLLSPGVMAMFLETQAAGMHDVLRRQKRRRARRRNRKETRDG